MAGIAMEYLRLSRIIKTDNKFTKAVGSVFPTVSKPGEYKFSNLNEAQVENVVDGILTLTSWALMRILQHMAFGSDTDKKKMDKWTKAILDNYEQQWSMTQLANDVTAGPAMFQTIFKLFNGTADLTTAILFDRTFIRDYLEEYGVVVDQTDPQWDHKVHNALKGLPYGSALIDVNDRIDELIDDKE